MKRSFLLALMVAFLVVGLSACTPRPAGQAASTNFTPGTESTLEIGRAAERANAPAPDTATPAAGALTPEEAMKLMLVQLLVTR